MVRVNVPLCTLGEGPLWHRETNEFVFTDIVKGLLYAWNPETDVCRILFESHFQLGAFLFDRQGDLILFTECGVYTCSYKMEGRKLDLLYSVDMVPGERFNDAICDPRGRMIAGTKTDDNKNGSLYLFEHGKSPRCLMEGLSISNGMGFSPDGTIFYHTDSGKRSIYRYQYHLENGTISHPALSLEGIPSDSGDFGEVIWQETAPDQAVPDGMTVDAQGNIWTALWGRGSLLHIDPVQKKLLSSFSLPAIQISSLTFGGKALDLLLITSASIETIGQPNGEIYCLCPGVQGREEYRF